MPQLESCPFKASLNKIPAEQNDGDEVDGRPLGPFFSFWNASRVWCIYRAATGIRKGHFVLLIKSWITKTTDKTKKHPPCIFLKKKPSSVSTLGKMLVEVIRVIQTQSVRDGGIHWRLYFDGCIHTIWVKAPVKNHREKMMEMRKLWWCVLPSPSAS